MIGATNGRVGLRRQALASSVVVKLQHTDLDHYPSFIVGSLFEWVHDRAAYSVGDDVTRSGTSH